MDFGEDAELRDAEFATGGRIVESGVWGHEDDPASAYRHLLLDG
jgi:hypothetical protein